MSDAKQELKKLIHTDPVHPAAAAAVIAQAKDTPGDDESEMDLDIDFDFINLDPTDIKPHFDRLGLTAPNVKKMAHRWVETDQRQYHKRMTQGWKPVEGGKIRNGSTMLCEMPLKRQQAMRRAIERRTADQQNSYMRSYEDEVNRKGGQHFKPFDGPRGPRDGLD